MDIFLLLLYLYIIFFNALSSIVPYLSYTDEIFTFALLGLAVIKMLNNGGRIRILKNNSRVVLCMLGIFIIGTLSTLRYGYVTSGSFIIRDVVLTFKFFIAYLCGNYVFEDYHSEKLINKLAIVAKIILIIIFIFGIVSLFVDIGMGSDYRYGFRAYQFIYSHYTYLVFNVVILLCTLLCGDNDSLLYDILGISILVMTLRTKAFMFAAFYIAVKLVYRKKINRENIARIFKLRYIVPAFILLIAASYDKIAEYISWGASYNLRNGLYIKGIQIAIDHFPLGSGFCTFATNLSRDVSPLYKSYSMMTYQGLSTGTGYLSDVYWPSIYAQFGFIGAILFVVALIFVVKELLGNRRNVSNSSVLSSICLIAYLLISSIAEASFSNETGVFSIIIIILIFLSGKIVSTQT